MTGLNVKRLVWTIIFLGITLAAIVMEVVAGVWHPAGTIPWTEYIAKYVPWPIQLIAYVALAVWLPFHFWRHDHLRKVAYERGRNDTLRRMERDAAARWIGPRTIDLISDEKLADALRRRGWTVPPPSQALLLPRDGN